MYMTEAIQKILTSPAAIEMINQLSPIYGEARVALWIFQSIGAEQDLMAQWTKEVEAQTFPQTATWAIPYWEDRYRIPRDPTMSTEKRRERIMIARTTRAPMNPNTMARIASAAANNAECRIEERSPTPANFIVWVSGFPDQSDIARIRTAVNQKKQARLSFDVRYEEYTEGEIYAAGALQMSYDITIRQVI